MFTASYVSVQVLKLVSTPIHTQCTAPFHTLWKSTSTLPDGHPSWRSISVPPGGQSPYQDSKGMSWWGRDEGRHAEDGRRKPGDRRPESGCGICGEGLMGGTPYLLYSMSENSKHFYRIPVKYFFIICDTASSLIDVVRIACTLHISDAAGAQLCKLYS